MKTPNVDPAPLQNALGAVKKSAAQIQASREREASLRKEIEDFLSNADPEDKEAVQIVSGRRTMAEMIPWQIKKLEKARGAQVEILVKEIDAFDRELRNRAIAERDALLTKVAGLLQPFCPGERIEAGARVDVARQVAERCPVFSLFPTEQVGMAALTTQPRDNNPEYFDAAAIVRAEELLGIAEAWRQNGGFVPKGSGKAA